MVFSPSCLNARWNSHFQWGRWSCNLNMCRWNSIEAGKIQKHTMWIRKIPYIVVIHFWRKWTSFPDPAVKIRNLWTRKKARHPSVRDANIPNIVWTLLRWLLLLWDPHQFDIYNGPFAITCSAQPIVLWYALEYKNAHDQYFSRGIGPKLMRTAGN